MSTCTFFGHRESYGLSITMLENTIKNLISQGVSTFYVGNQGSFDTAVYGCLKKLQKTFPIKVYVILAYIPTENTHL